MLFSSMNRALLLSFISLFCFFGLIACQSKNMRHLAHDRKEASVAPPAKDSFTGVAGPDTAMLSLKTFRAVALTEVISQDWKLEDADQAHWNEIFWDSASDTRQYPELALFRDFTVTENARYGLQMGKWRLNKDKRELVLQFAHGLSKTYIIRQIAMKQMELVWKRKDDSVIIKLSAEAMVHKRPLEDPFYPTNNQWRIKPPASETNEQIRLRVKDFVHFYSLFFWDNHRRQETEISFSGLPCCFIWYNGGIGMQGKIDLDKKWINCFYSGDQALKGYDMLASLLEKHELKWPEHPTSWVKQTAEVLDQIYNKL